jgi:hypothetical protein
LNWRWRQRRGQALLAPTELEASVSLDVDRARHAGGLSVIACELDSVLFDPTSDAASRHHRRWRIDRGAGIDDAAAALRAAAGEGARGGLQQPRPASALFLVSISAGRRHAARLSRRSEK